MAVLDPDPIIVARVYDVLRGSELQALTDASLIQLVLL